MNDVVAHRPERQKQADLCQFQADQGSLLSPMKERGEGEKGLRKGERRKKKGR